MNDQELNAMRVRIAEYVDPRQHKPGTGRVIKGEPIWIIDGKHPITCANYTGCLNAMADAEEVLSESQLLEYAELIYWHEDCRGLIRRAIRATARQRATAFLRTIGGREG